MSSWKGGFVIAFGLLVLLAGSAAAAPQASKTPAPAAASAPGSNATFEGFFSEQLLAAMLTAGAPYEQAMEEEVGVGPFSKTVHVDVKLTDPKVKVQKDGIHVTMSYQVTDPSGLLNTSGIATPLMQITPIPGKNVFEAKLTSAGVTVAGVELPLEDALDPIELPAVYPDELDLGDKTVTAEAHATDLILEDGRVHVKGYVLFLPKAPAKK
jgi:hypothetical protein